MPNPKLPGAGRPAPPEDFSPEEAKIWKAFVDSRPDHYFGEETWPMLEALCMHTVQLRQIAKQMRQRGPSVDLRNQHRQQSAMICTLSSRLRLSKMGLKAATRDEHKEIDRTPRRRLWDSAA